MWYAHCILLQISEILINILGCFRAEQRQIFYWLEEGEHTRKGQWTMDWKKALLSKNKHIPVDEKIDVLLLNIFYGENPAWRARTLRCFSFQSMSVVLFLSRTFVDQRERNKVPVKIRLFQLSEKMCARQISNYGGAIAIVFNTVMKWRKIYFS